MPIFYVLVYEARATLGSACHLMLGTAFISNKKLLVLGAVNTTISDQGCQHVTGSFESIRMLLNKPAGWPTFVQPHQMVKPVE